MRDEETVALNRRARHEFTIDETFEAGIVLTGTEISRSGGKANRPTRRAHEAARRADRGPYRPVERHRYNKSQGIR